MFIVIVIVIKTRHFLYESVSL